MATMAQVADGSNTIEKRMTLLDSAIESGCAETIQQSLVDWRRSICDYYLGERLLWKLYGVLGGKPRQRA